MKTIATKRRSDPFVVLYCDEIIDLLLAHISRICTVRKDPNSRVNFTVVISATALVKEYQVSTIDHAILGGASPNYFITVDGLLKEQIFECLKE